MGRIEIQPEVVEQVLVSRSVVRQADKLPPEMVEYHRNILQELGFIAELVANLPVEYWLEVLDYAQAEKYGF